MRYGVFLLIYKRFQRFLLLSFSIDTGTKVRSLTAQSGNKYLDCV